MTVEQVAAPVAADDIGAAVDATIVAERAGVLSHARTVCASITAIEGRGGLAQADASFVRRVVLNFANDIAIGFHVDGEPSRAVQAQMRALRERDHG